VQALDEALRQFLVATAPGDKEARAARERVDDAKDTVAHMHDRSIDAVRARFSDLSKEISGLLALIGPTNIDVTLYAFDCPMAGGSWFQREEDPQNPYYGFSMRACGDSVDLLKQQ
jgi:hypothetical protein